MRSCWTCWHSRALPECLTSVDFIYQAEWKHSVGVWCWWAVGKKNHSDSSLTLKVASKYQNSYFSRKNPCAVLKLDTNGAHPVLILDPPRLSAAVPRCPHFSIHLSLRTSLCASVRACVHVCCHFHFQLLFQLMRTLLPQCWSVVLIENTQNTVIKVCMLAFIDFYAACNMFWKLRKVSSTRQCLENTLWWCFAAT